jgi:hypothetical protein
VQCPQVIPTTAKDSVFMLEVYPWGVSRFNHVPPGD